MYPQYNNNFKKKKSQENMSTFGKNKIFRVLDLDLLSTSS
jgi:hypothetical protein